MGNYSDKNLQESLVKYEKLKNYLVNLGSVAIAFSGGVDSALLLKTAHGVLGSRTAAVTLCAPIFPDREFNEAKEFCAQFGIRQIICRQDPLRIEGFSKNPINRCYLCKRAMMQAAMQAAKEQGFAFAAEGSVMDDKMDYRPGRQAVLELGIKSPLLEAGMEKEDVRRISKMLGLATWKKQSFACLASRFAYGEQITEEKLSMVSKAEQLLLDMGFCQVRVRIHSGCDGQGVSARIEVPADEFARLVQEEVRSRVVGGFLSYGFTYVAMDLKGYRTGSMNEALKAALPVEGDGVVVGSGG